MKIEKIFFNHIEKTYFATMQSLASRFSAGMFLTEFQAKEIIEKFNFLNEEVSGGDTLYYAP